MKNFIIHIIRSTKAFPSTNFFLNTLEWNLKKNTNDVNYVEVYDGTKNEDGDIKAKLTIISSDKDVKGWCLMNKVDCQDPTPKLEEKANKLISFWNGPAFRSLPEEMQSDDDWTISEKIKEYYERIRGTNKFDGKGPGIEVVNRYPSVKFRAKQKLNSIKKKGMIPTQEMFVEEYTKNTKLADELRDRVTWRDDPLPIDEDTGVSISKEENDTNKDLLNSYTFNANLAMACAQEFIH